MNDVLTVGSKTSTGGKIISGNSGVTVNGQAIALVGDKATCLCGSSSCKGVGEIVPIVPRAANVQGVNFARAGDFVNTGCGNCFLVKGSHQVHLGTSMDSTVHIGSNVHIGNDVSINMGHMSAEENEEEASRHALMSAFSSNSSHHHSSQSPITHKKKTNEKVYAKACSNSYGDTSASILREVFKHSMNEFGLFADIGSLIIPKAHAGVLSEGMLMGEENTAVTSSRFAGQSNQSKWNKNAAIQLTKVAGNIQDSVLSDWRLFTKEAKKGEQKIEALFIGRATQYDDHTQYTEDQLRKIEHAATRIRVRMEAPKNGSPYPSIEPYHVGHGNVPVRHVKQEKNGDFSVQLTDDTPPIYWTPDKSKTPLPTTTPSQDDGVDFNNLIITPVTTYPAGIKHVNPIQDQTDWHDLILIFPENSGIKPLYVVFNSHSYIPKPKGNPALPAFPDAKKAKEKTYVQGGGKKRPRWKDQKRIYEWDSQHGKVEVYDKNGNHLGEFDHITGKQTKPADKNRKVEK